MAPHRPRKPQRDVQISVRSVWRTAASGTHSQDETQGMATVGDRRACHTGGLHPQAGVGRGGGSYSALVSAQEFSTSARRRRLPGAKKP
ncbi:MAG: hypothetical protein R3A44_25605 [Caldilineaceae bacterium]